MNFFQIKEKPAGRGAVDIYPDFITVRSSDLMIRGNRFYAIWDEEKQTWSTDEYDVQRIVDDALMKYYQENKGRYLSNQVNVLFMKSFRSKTLLEFKKFVSSVADNYHQLDEKITFTNSETKRSDYISMHVPYPLIPGPCDAYDQLVGTLYSEEERRKFEWAIGSIIAGDSKKIQKFIVFYGEGGTGKSTVLNIIQQLFKGYYTMFNSKRLGSGERFCMEPFKSNPLVGIEHDGDLSKIADNTALNQIVAHEEIAMDLKNIPIFSMKINSFLFMGTNKPVQITDAKSGLIRRLIDVVPTGQRLDFDEYNRLMERIEFELPAIASKCLDIYKRLGKSYYNNYVPRGMMYETDPFYNFVEDCYFTFKEEDGITVKDAYQLYKNYCDDAGILTRLNRYRFRSELKNYFEHFDDLTRVDGKQVRSYYSGFKHEKFDVEKKPKSKENKLKSNIWLELKEQVSLFDKIFADRPAQYAVESKTGGEVPSMAWAKVKTHLSDIDTSKVHYVMPPENLVTIDFDIKDENGDKCFQKNLEAAAKWPPTYAELSKGGSGIHLEYFYEGDISQLSSLYAQDVEVKTYTGRSSLRRRLSKCNDISIATISSGLPLKEARKTVNFESIANEKALRTMITKNLRKEYSPHTRPSIDFIYNDLEAAYKQGLKYDVSDMRQKVMTMACKSTHQAEYCIALVGKMKFKSDEPSVNKEDGYVEDPILFFDCEVFPNLFIIVWKREGDPDCVRMINPTPAEVRHLMEFKLIGFNNRRYDNHILYARAFKNYTNEELFELSKKIVGKENARAALFGEAYNVSYTDIYDYCAKKQGLKKWEIELGISHKENDLPWDQPVPEDKWQQVADYCVNDVLATEAVHKANQQDFKARQMLADISKKLMGYGTVNDTTNQLTTRIILRGDKDANKQFVYPDLKKRFPGYEFSPIGFPEERYYNETFEKGGTRLSHKSFYKGCDPSEGGRVFAKPGMYSDVWTFDVASMHPSSLIAENGFGKYTKNLKDLLDIRLCIKHGDYKALYDFFDGALAPYADEIIAEKDKDKQKKKAKALSYALKIAINSVYGLTSAKFENALRDPKNIDNWVAKRGALFMIDLQQAVEAKGFTVVHVKTDSIKVAHPNEEIKEFIINYGKQFGYTFEVEAVYDRICLVNRSTYIAKYSDKHPEEDERGQWTATGDQFKQPFVFKTLFSKEPIGFDDLCETKTVQTALYLDFNENLPEGEHNYHFVGRAGRFCPILPGHNAGRLVRDAGDGKYNNAEGSTGYLWMEAEVVKGLNMEDAIDISYYRALCDQAKEDIGKFGDFEMFVSANTFSEASDQDPPWDP